jgi:hypothetical protein
MSVASRCSLVALFTVAAAALAAPLQETKSASKPVFLAVKGTKYLKDITKLVPHTVEVDNQEIVAVAPPDDEEVEFTLTGRKVGSTRLTIINKAGEKEQIELVVRTGRWLPLDTVLPLKLSSEQPLHLFAAENEKIVRLQAVKGDPTAVEVVGLAEGETSVKLTGRDGSVETVQFFVTHCAHVVTVGETIALHMKNNQQFCRVKNGRPEVGELGKWKNHREVAFTGLAPGIAIVKFSGPAAEVEETILVGVQPKPE